MTKQKKILKKYTQNKTKRKREKKRKKNTQFFRMTFYMYFTCFFIKISLAQTIYVIGIMLSFRFYFFVKAIVFFQLSKAISFSIILTFQNSAMRLFIFMIFFSGFIT